MFCKKCGNELVDGTKFCPKCGTATTLNNANELKKSLNDSVEKAKKFAKETVSNEKVQEFTNKVEEVAKNVNNSDFANDIKKEASKVKENITKEWNKTDANVMTSVNEKFYQKTLFIILMLIFVFPVGIFLMWKYNKFGSGKKRILITVCALIWGIIICAPSSNDKTDSNDNSNTSNYYTIDPKTGKRYTLDAGEEIKYNVWGEQIDDTKTNKNNVQGNDKVNSKFIKEIEKYVDNECKYAKWDENLDWMENQGVGCGVISKDDYDAKVEYAKSIIDEMVRVNSLENEYGGENNTLYIGIDINNNGEAILLFD